MGGFHSIIWSQKLRIGLKLGSDNNHTIHRFPQWWETSVAVARYDLATILCVGSERPLYHKELRSDSEIF